MKQAIYFLFVVALSSFASSLNGQNEDSKQQGDRPAAQSGNRGGQRGGQRNRQRGNAQAAQPKAVAVNDGVAKLTPENTRVNFVGTHNGDEPNPRLGGFKKFSGKLKMSQNGDSIQSMTMEFETNSMWTELGAKLTDHLKNEDFLDVEKYPTAKFVSKKVIPSDRVGMLNVVGDFTLMGKTNEISIPVKLKKDDAGILVKGEVKLDRASFGMNKMLDRVNKDVAITLSIGEKTAGGAAPAQGGRGQGGRRGFDVGAMFKNQDADKDGKLTGDEIPERMRGFMDRVDTDEDGSISLKEMETMIKSRQRGQGGGR